VERRGDVTYFGEPLRVRPGWKRLPPTHSASRPRRPVRRAPRQPLLTFTLEELVHLPDGETRPPCSPPDVSKSVERLFPTRCAGTSRTGLGEDTQGPGGSGGLVHGRCRLRGVGSGTAQVARFARSAARSAPSTAPISESAGTESACSSPARSRARVRTTSSRKGSPAPGAQASSSSPAAIAAARKGADKGFGRGPSVAFCWSSPAVTPRILSQGAGRLPVGTREHGVRKADSGSLRAYH
jgi:hypothetical protein